MYVVYVTVYAVGAPVCSPMSKVRSYAFEAGSSCEVGYEQPDASRNK
jgi:hypothetical protein